MQLHPPRVPQPPRHLVLAGLYGLLRSAPSREANTLERFSAYYMVTHAEKRRVAGLLIQNYMQGYLEIVGAWAVEEVDELAEKYSYSAAEVRELALEVYRGTEKDTDFQVDGDARELGEEIRSHVLDWFLNRIPPTQEELDTTAEYYGYWGHEKALIKLGEQEGGEVDQSTELIQALLSNYIDDDNDLQIDKLGVVERQLLNDAGISTVS